MYTNIVHLEGFWSMFTLDPIKFVNEGGNFRETLAVYGNHSGIDIGYFVFIYSTPEYAAGRGPCKDGSSI